MPNTSSGDMALVVLPSKVTVPVEPMTRESALSVVVLPAPFEPTSATISARRTSKEISRSTCSPP